jgi:hypothetical protein
VLKAIEMDWGGFEMGIYILLKIDLGTTCRASKLVLKRRCGLREIG